MQPKQRILKDLLPNAKPSLGLCLKHVDSCSLPSLLGHCVYRRHNNITDERELLLVQCFFLLLVQSCSPAALWDQHMLKPSKESKLKSRGNCVLHVVTAVDNVVQGCHLHFPSVNVLALQFPEEKQSHLKCSWDVASDKQRISLCE